MVHINDSHYEYVPKHGMVIYGVSEYMQSRSLDWRQKHLSKPPPFEVSNGSTHQQSKSTRSMNLTEIVSRKLACHVSSSRSSDVTVWRHSHIGLNALSGPLKGEGGSKNVTRTRETSVTWCRLSVKCDRRHIVRGGEHLQRPPVDASPGSRPSTAAPTSSIPGSDSHQSQDDRPPYDNTSTHTYAHTVSNTTGQTAGETRQQKAQCRDIQCFIRCAAVIVRFSYSTLSHVCRPTSAGMIH